VHALTALFAAAAVAVGATGCRDRVSRGQCDQLLARYAELVVQERLPDASAAVVDSERKREREEATSDDAFRNCTAEVQPAEYLCAMAAASADALEKCLE
jgi:hypothetical protein